MITGINHVTFTVRDVDESVQFYGVVLGFRLLARWPRGAYFAAGDLWVALVLGERSGVLAEYTHVAFNVDPKDFDRCSKKIRESGAVIWKDNESEGASLYFLDPSGHKLELHATDLAARLRACREKPWEGLELFDRDTIVDEG